jgi:hypothetical protein
MIILFSNVIFQTNMSKKDHLREYVTIIKYNINSILLLSEYIKEILNYCLL